MELHLYSMFIAEILTGRRNCREFIPIESLQIYTERILNESAQTFNMLYEKDVFSLLAG